MKLLILSAALLSSVPMAQTYADLAALDRAVADFTGAAPGEPGGATAPIDRRLRLVRCAAPLVLNWYGANRGTVVVRCPAGVGWRIFVPVAPGAHGSEGADMAASPAVTRGEQVNVMVSGAGFSLSQAAEALESGPVGAWIRVRTSSAGQGFRARIVRPGLVALPADKGLP